MTGYVIRRILWMIPLMWAVATITFLLMHAVPGGPFASEKPVPPSVEAALNARYNLDEPLWNQYLLYFQDLLQGDLGISFRGDIEVIDLLAQGLPVTLQLGCLAFLYAIIIGMSLALSPL